LSPSRLAVSASFGAATAEGPVDEVAQGGARGNHAARGHCVTNFVRGVVPRPARLGFPARPPRHLGDGLASQVDTFIAVGELALFVALADSWTVRSRAAAWTMTVLGLAVSVAGNVGHIGAHDWASRLG